jgi:hypothetical protein
MSTGRLLFAFLFIAGTGLLGQDALKKGSYSLSGEISFAQSTTKWQAERNFDDGSSSSYELTEEEMVINFSPNGTLFIADNFAVGLVLGYRYSESTFKSPYWDDSKDIYRPYSVGPVLRYYFPTESVHPFIDGRFLYSNEIAGNRDALSYTLAGGLNIFISETAALEPFIQYSWSEDTFWDYKTIGFSLGMRVSYFIID